MRNKIFGTLAALALAVGLAACSPVDTEGAKPAPSQTQQEQAPAPQTEAPAPAPQAQYTPEELAFIQTYTDYYPSPGREAEVLAAGYESCTAMKRWMDSGGLFSEFVVNLSEAVDDQEHAATIIGGALGVLCPELKDHPNFDIDFSGSA